MLNEFYEFIAKKVNSFFQKAASDGTLLKGESFCLKLDNDDMVAKVSSALKHRKRLIFRYDRKIPDYFSVAGAP